MASMAGQIGRGGKIYQGGKSGSGGQGPLMARPGQVAGLRPASSQPQKLGNVGSPPRANMDYRAAVSPARGQGMNSPVFYSTQPLNSQSTLADIGQGYNLSIVDLMDNDAYEPYSEDYYIDGVANRESNSVRSKRNSPDGDTVADKVRERIIHLELENRFLEERVKVVEEEARCGRLRIDELRCELRECSEERDAERKRAAQQSADLQEMFQLYEHAVKKWRTLLDEKKAARAAGTPWKASTSD
ncbi:hypothetical protein R1sor_017262 [Riccia sorocarpa]|uniref:Uncharacterized protein n=1 Tax=Riccia sorocarpa TaxID=122646 RepID=A0ABD3I6A8_9MARC